MLGETCFCTLKLFQTFSLLWHEWLDHKQRVYIMFHHAIKTTKKCSANRIKLVQTRWCLILEPNVFYRLKNSRMKSNNTKLLSIYLSKVTWKEEFEMSVQLLLAPSPAFCLKKRNDGLRKRVQYNLKKTYIFKNSKEDLGRKIINPHVPTKN